MVLRAGHYARLAKTDQDGQLKFPVEKVIPYGRKRKEIEKKQKKSERVIEVVEESYWFFYVDDGTANCCAYQALLWELSGLFGQTCPGKLSENSGFKGKVYRVSQLECIKMFFHSKSGWERQWSVSVWAVFQLSPTAREFYVLPDQKDATPRTISPSSLYRCICKRGERVALHTAQACIVIRWQVDPFRVRFFFFLSILKVVARSSLLLKPLVERSFLLGRIGGESVPLDSALWRRLYQLLPRWVRLRPKDWRKSKEGRM